MAFIALSLTTGLSGCSGDQPQTYEASGRVVFPDGAPLTSGSVELETADRGPPLNARGPIGADGSFTLGTFESGDGAVEGRHRVAISVPLPEGTVDDPKLIRHVIDPRFNSFSTSGLEVQVGDNAAENEFQITISAPASRNR